MIMAINNVKKVKEIIQLLGNIYSDKVLLKKLIIIHLLIFLLILKMLKMKMILILSIWLCKINNNRI